MLKHLITRRKFITLIGLLGLVAIINPKIIGKGQVISKIHYKITATPDYKGGIV